MKLGVKILPRDEVLDSQGRAVEATLRQGGIGVSSCRVGKYIQLEMEARTSAEAEKRVKEMVDYVLVNPLIEAYEIEVLES